MKRKKQVETPSKGQGEEPIRKGTRRPGATVESTAEEDGELDSIQIIPWRKKSRRSSTSEDDYESAPSHETYEDDNGIEGDEQEESSKGTDAEDDSEVENIVPIKRGKMGGASSVSKAQSNDTTPIKGKNPFSTPIKTNDTSGANDTPRLKRHADRSARRKSTRNKTKIGMRTINPIL